jgi:hypothetical protein
MARVPFIQPLADLYQVDGRTIKRWVAKAKDSRFPADFTSPASVVAWWEECMATRPPVGILLAAIRAGVDLPAIPLPPKVKEEIADHPSLFDWVSGSGV